MNNKVILRGIVNDIKYSHEKEGRKYYTGKIITVRNSGKEDIIPLIIKEPVAVQLEQGKEYTLTGQFRSRNILVGEKRRLELSAYITGISEETEISNYVELDGFICKEPKYRITPFNRKITDLLVAVNRTYHNSDYIPCITWGEYAEVSSKYNVADEVVLKGRIQSRDYEKDGETRTAYEVSVREISLKNNTNSDC